MAKSKNHTNHNQNRKAHRNPIRRPKVRIHASMSGVCPKFMKNLKYARKNNISVVQQAKKHQQKKVEQLVQLRRKQKCINRLAEMKAKKDPKFAAKLETMKAHRIACNPKLRKAARKTAEKEKVEAKAKAKK